jgi:asparagine synthase (glutamine-hydrolysing)
MGNSLEVRVPFLDHRLVEFAFSLPDDLCVRGKIKKYILRRFLERKRGSHVANLPKRGFSCPVNYFWSAEDMRKELVQGKLIKSGILSGQAARSIIDSSADTGNLKIWLLAVLEQWYARWLA